LFQGVPWCVFPNVSAISKKGVWELVVHPNCAEDEKLLALRAATFDEYLKQKGQAIAKQKLQELVDTASSTLTFSIVDGLHRNLVLKILENSIGTRYLKMLSDFENGYVC